MPRFKLALILIIIGALAVLVFPTSVFAQHQDVKIGNYFVDSPYGIAFIVDDAAGFLIDPVWKEKGAKSKWSRMMRHTSLPR